MQLMTSVYCLYLFSALKAATGLERTQYPAFMSLTSNVDVCQMIVPGPGWGGPRDDPDDPICLSASSWAPEGSLGHVVLPELGE